MSDQFYVLMQIDYQDNEGIFYRSSGSSGYPKNVFTSKKKADKVALQKNLSELEDLIRDSQIKNYGSNLYDVISSKTLEDELLFEEGIFMTVFGETAEDWWEHMRNLNWGESLPLKIEPSPEQWRKLYDCFSLRFWEVVEVEGDCSPSQDTTLTVRSCGAQGGMICGYAPHDECWDCREYWKAREPASAEINL